MKNRLKFVLHITMNKLIVQTNWAYKMSLKLLIPLQMRLVSSSVNTGYNSPITVVRVNYCSWVIRGQNFPSWNGDNQVCRPTYIILKWTWNFRKKSFWRSWQSVQLLLLYFHLKTETKIKRIFFYTIIFVNSTTVLFDSGVRLINSLLSLIQLTKHNLAYTTMTLINCCIF